MILDKVTYQANPLIESRKNYNIQEMRLFYLGLQGLFPCLPNCGDNRNYYDTEFKPVFIPTNELIPLFGGNKGYYEVLRNTCEKLIHKAIFIEKPNKKGFEGLAVFSKLRFDVDEGGLTIKFNEDMKPYLLDLANKPYTKITMRQVFNLESDYAMRLLELLLQYQNTKTKSRELSIDDLRRYLNVPDLAYKDRINNFKKYVLDNPIREINTKTRYILKYETIKKGRVVCGFRLFLEIQKDEIKRNLNIDQTDKILNLSADHNISCDLLMGCGIIKKQAIELTLKFSRKRISANIKYAISANPDNLSGYVITAINDDYACSENVNLYEKKKTEEKGKYIELAKKRDAQQIADLEKVEAIKRSDKKVNNINESPFMQNLLALKARLS